MARQRPGFTLPAFRGALRFVILFVLLFGLIVPLNPSAVPAAQAAGDSPTITNLSVTEAANDFDTNLTITGTNFYTPLTVKLGDTELPYPRVNQAGTELKLVVPWGLTPGDYDLTITNNNNLSVTLPQAFKVLPGLNTLTSEGPYGGGVMAMVLYPYNASILLADMGLSGIYRTIDGGDHWKQVFQPADYFASLSVDPHNPDRVYVARQGVGLFYSDNYSDDREGVSVTFQPVPLPLNGKTAIDSRAFVHPGKLGVVFAGVYADQRSCSSSDVICGLFRSVDNGANWVKVSDYAVASMTFDPTDPDTYYIAVNDSHVYQTTDDGATWTDLGNILKYQEPYQLMMNPFNPTQLWAYGKFGVHHDDEQGGHSHAMAFYENGAWTYPETGFPLNHAVCQIEYDTRQAQPRLVVVTDGGIYTSADGATYTLLSDKMTGPCGSIALDTGGYPGSQNVFYTSYNALGVFKTADDGQTYTNKSYGLTGFTINDLRASPQAPSTVYAIAQDVALFKTTNGGANWHKLPVNVAPGAIAPLALDPSTDGRLYLGSFFSYLAGANGGEANADWQRVNMSWSDVTSHPDLMLAQFSSCQLRESMSLAIAKGAGAGGKDRLFMGISYGSFNYTEGQPNYCSDGKQLAGMAVFASDNQGENWTPVLVSITDIFPYYLAVDPADPQRVFLGATDDINNKYGIRHIYSSLSGGAKNSWQNSGLSLPINWAFSFITVGKDHTLLTSMGSYLGVSTDNGKTWTPISDAGALIKKIVYDPSVFGLYIGTERGIRVSYDDGLTWKAIPGSLGQADITGLDVRQVGSRTFIYASTPGGSLGGATSPARSGLAPAASNELLAGIYRYTVTNSTVYLPGMFKSATGAQ